MSDPSLPPPSYEVSQQELDRKVAHAIEASINQPAPAPTRSDDDFFYDEAAFEAAFEAAVKINQTRSQESSSSTSRLQPAPQPSGSSPAIPPTNVQPLRINKRTSAPPKTIVSPPAQKERPSWLDRAEGGSSSSTRGVPPPSSNTTQGTLSSASGSSRLSPNTIEEDEEEDMSVPPPSFAAAVASSPQGSTLNVFSPYHGDGSNPPSPLASPTPSNTVLPTQQHQDFDLPNPHETRSTRSHFPVSHSQLPNPHPHLPGPSHPNRASLPPPATVVPRRIVRPTSVAYTSTTPKAVVHQPSQMEFDARSVYNRPARTQPMQGVNAASFYNSAVSAHMTPTSCVSRTNNPNNRRSEYFAASTPQQQQPQQFYFQQQQPMYDPQQPYMQQQNPYVQQPSYGVYQPSTAQPMAGYGQQQQFSGVQSGWSS